MVIHKNSGGVKVVIVLFNAKTESVHWNAERWYGMANVKDFLVDVLVGCSSQEVREVAYLQFTNLINIATPTEMHPKQFLTQVSVFNIFNEYCSLKSVVCLSKLSSLIRCIIIIESNLCCFKYMFLYVIRYFKMLQDLVSLLYFVWILFNIT